MWRRFGILAPCVCQFVCVGAADRGRYREQCTLSNVMAPKGVFNGGVRDSSCICTAGSQNKHINKMEWNV